MSFDFYEQTSLPFVSILECQGEPSSLIGSRHDITQTALDPFSKSTNTGIDAQRVLPTTDRLCRKS